jgi:hypothetical protein
MRYIDLTTFQPSVNWLQIAANHTSTILPFTRGQRSDYFDETNNKHWNEPVFLDLLKEHGKRKCWYSESRSEIQLFVDHFRPKLMVTKITGSYQYAEAGTRPLQNGYYWLAYSYQNFRVVNNVSNKRKGAYFPLESNSVSVETYPTGDISPEINMLLDPCVKTDVNLILYNIIKPKPSYTLVQNAQNYHRAEMSIMAYSLDDSLLQTLRKKTLKMCNNLYIEAEKAFILNDLISFSTNCSKLVDMLSPEAEFTMMIEHRLIGLNKDWLEAYVLNEARNLNFI